LDDSTRENGCLNYVPGSHKWPDLPKPVLTGEMDGIRDTLPEELKDKFKPVSVELKKVRVRFTMLERCTVRARTIRPHRVGATVINAFRDGVMSNADEHCSRVFP